MIIHDLIICVIVKVIQTQRDLSARKGYRQYCQLKKFQMWILMIFTLGMGKLIVMSIRNYLIMRMSLGPMPDYPLWTAAVSLAGGNAVHYLCDEANWYPDL